MNTQKPFKWSNLILIALLIVVILIPLVMSRAGKKVDSWSRATNIEKTMKSLESLETLEGLEALEDLPEIQAELDSFLENFEMPEMDTFMFIIPSPPDIELGINGRKITIGKQKGFAYYPEPPEILGGSKAIYDHLVYPEKLKKAGVEGMVMVQVYVEKDGSVGKAKLMHGDEHELFDKAALDAVKQIKFKPIIQDEKALSVWVALPVFFRLD